MTAPPRGDTRGLRRVRAVRGGAEDITFAKEAGEYEQGVGTFLAAARARSHFDASRRWPTGWVPDDFHDNVTSEVSVPIVNGTNDPVTPPQWGEDAERSKTWAPAWRRSRPRSWPTGK